MAKTTCYLGAASDNSCIGSKIWFELNVGNVDEARIVQMGVQTSGDEVATPDRPDPCPLPVEADKSSVALNVRGMSQSGPRPPVGVRQLTGELQPVSQFVP